MTDAAPTTGTATHRASPPGDSDPARGAAPRPGDGSGHPGHLGHLGQLGEPADGMAHACARPWFALRAIHARIAGALAADLADACGITLNECDVLIALASDDPATAADPAGRCLGDLADHVDLSQPAISRLVSRLEDRGLLRRRDGAPDRRTVLLELTPAGADLARRAAAVQAAAIDRLVLGRLTRAEHDALASLFARLTG